MRIIYTLFIRIIYTLFISLTCLVVTATGSYASVEAHEELQVKEENITSSDLQKVLTFQENNRDSEIKEKEREKQNIELDNALTRARLEKELAELQADIARMMVEREAIALKWQIAQEEKEKAHTEEMLTLNQQREKLEAELDIARYKLDKEEQRLRAITTKVDHQVKLLLAEVDQMNAQKARHEAKYEDTTYTDAAPIYLKEPLQKGDSLVISDRRIELDGCITPWKADYVTDRIQYFNNKDASNPIFIVIESSPGGSVRAGACILKAMENSQAPVYVVVKSFAASMAALITTLADKSYAYPNAIILHHQPWTFTWGNVREIKEQQEFLQEWWNRLGGRVAKKMGIPLKKLDKLLYEKSAKGDWVEFADHAEKLKWVDHTINGIKESSIRELPNPENYTWEIYRKKDYWWNNHEAAYAIENGVVYLPPLDAKDFYYLYNPDNLYQMRSPSK
jgi:ATP-dependent Clp protease, protease subunit